MSETHQIVTTLDASQLKCWLWPVNEPRFDPRIHRGISRSCHPEPRWFVWFTGDMELRNQSSDAAFEVFAPCGNGDVLEFWPKCYDCGKPAPKRTPIGFKSCRDHVRILSCDAITIDPLRRTVARVEVVQCDIEKCEWNPDENRAAYTTEQHDSRVAFLVNSPKNGGSFRLCRTCAELPAFARSKKRPVKRPVADQWHRQHPGAECPEWCWRVTWECGRASSDNASNRNDA